MNDPLGTDLYLDADSGDLAVENGDLKTVSGLACLCQNLACALETGYGDWGGELLAGSGVAAAVEMTGPYFEPTVRDKVREVCRWDGRVDMDDIEFVFTYSSEDGAYVRGEVSLKAVAGALKEMVLPLPEKTGEA